MKAQVEFLADELRPIVEPDRHGAADLSDNPLERFHDIAAAVTLPHVYRRRQPGEGVDDGQNADLAPVDNSRSNAIGRSEAGPVAEGFAR